MTRWWQATQRIVRSDLVVSLQPVVGDLLHVGERIEQVGCQHLFSICPIEPLDERVLVRLARLDEAQLDALGLAPLGARREIRIRERVVTHVVDSYGERSPEVRAERERIGWTPAVAAAAVCVTPRAWAHWEAGARSMPPGMWLLFRLMTGATGVQYATPSDGRAVLKLRINAQLGRSLPLL